MRFRSWLALGWAVGGACGGSALPVEGETCGPNGECASGLVCDPITDTCVPRGSNLAVSITSPSNGAGCTNQRVAFDTVTPGEPVRFECSLDGVPFSP